MKKSFRGILTLMLGMALSGLAAAQSGDQQGPPPEHNGGQNGGQMERGGSEGGRRGMPSPEERLKRMTEQLNLTADQQTKIKTIMESEKTKMDALRDDTSVEGPAKREKAMQIRKDSQAAIRETLTADQQAKFDKMQAEMKNRGERRGPPPPPQN